MVRYFSSSIVCRVCFGISVPRMKTRSAAVVSSNGSPDQMTRSASLPTSSDPVRSAMPHVRAAFKCHGAQRRVAIQAVGRPRCPPPDAGCARCACRTTTAPRSRRPAAAARRSRATRRARRSVGMLVSGLTTTGIFFFASSSATIHPSAAPTRTSFSLNSSARRIAASRSLARLAWTASGISPRMTGRSASRSSRPRA